MWKMKLKIDVEFTPDLENTKEEIYQPKSKRIEKKQDMYQQIQSKLRGEPPSKRKYLPE
jgi:hypothetical protein